MYINVKNALGDMNGFFSHNFTVGEWSAFKDRYLDELAVYYLWSRNEEWGIFLKRWLPALVVGQIELIISGLYNPIPKAKWWMVNHAIEGSEWDVKVAPAIQERAMEFAEESEKRRAEWENQFHNLYMRKR